LDRNTLKYSYFDIKTLSELTGISPRTLKDRCIKNKYQIRKIHANGGKSGLKYEILFSSLEYELQNKILINLDEIKDALNNKCKTLSNLNSSDANSIYSGDDLNKIEKSPASFDLPNNMLYSLAVNTTNNEINSHSFQKVIPQQAKKLALAKYDLIINWQDYRNKLKDKKEADNNYIIAYNNSLINEELYEIIGKISKATLYRWHKTLKDNNNNYLSLINDYNYTSKSQLNSSLTDIEKQEFIKLYYNDAKLNISTAYELLKIKFSNCNLKIKSIATYRRFVNFIKRNHKDFEILSRHGEKALKDQVSPFNRRDISDIKTGDILVADGNKLDFMVINPYTGKPARAIWVVFFDWYSFDVAGWEIMLTENTQNISSALRNAILRLGKIPKKVYMDNGRAFRGKYFKGCSDFNNCGFNGIYKNLGIKEVVAKPYNGRSKIVERFFGDFVRQCPPLISSYIGNSIANKPAHLNRNEKFHKDLHKNNKVPTIEQAKLIIENWLNEFHRKKACPHNKTITIREAFESGIGKGIDADMLDELMMSECVRSAKRNTIKLFGLEYECAELYGLEDKFTIKYSLFDITKIKIYSLKNEYIGEAKIVSPVKAFIQDGSALDLYNYRVQQKKYANMFKTTLNKTKALIGTQPFQNINWLNIEKGENNKLQKTKKKKLEITLYENIKEDFQEKQQLII